jgi:hypothetical protein
MLVGSRGAAHDELLREPVRQLSGTGRSRHELRADQGEQHGEAEQRGHAQANATAAAGPLEWLGAEQGPPELEPVPAAARRSSSATILGT